MNQPNTFFHNDNKYKDKLNSKNYDNLFVNNFLEKDDFSSRKDGLNKITKITNDINTNTDFYNKQDSLQVKINKMREKSKDRVSDQFFGESINSTNISSSKINKNEIQNKVNKYYKQMPSYNADMKTTKETFGSSYKEKLSNVDKIRNNMNIFKDKR